MDYKLTSQSGKLCRILHNPEHLKLSDKESEDLAKFTRWIIRRERGDILAEGASAVDAGCGNGRNLIYLAKNFNMKGVGVDISSAAIAQAKKASTELDINYHVGSAGDTLPTEDESQTLKIQ